MARPGRTAAALDAAEDRHCAGRATILRSLRLILLPVAGLLAFIVPANADGSGAGPAAQTDTAAAAVDEDFAVTRPLSVISNFLSRRADLITSSEPDLVGRLDGPRSSSGLPLGIALSGTQAHLNVAFATSMSELAAKSPLSAPDRLTTAFGPLVPVRQQPGGQAGGRRSGLDLWIKGQWAHVDNQTRKSDFGLVRLGADYLLNPLLRIGILAQFDWMDDKDAPARTAADGMGWMAGPYVVAQLHQKLRFGGRVAWGQSNSHADPLGPDTERFDTDRWLARGQLTGDFRKGNWRFNPHVAAIYFGEDQKASADSPGVAIPDQAVSSGRVTFGPAASYLLRSPGIEFEPRIGAKGIWTPDKPDIVDLGTGLAAGSSGDLRARLEGGVSVRLAGGTSLAGEAFYDGIGVDDLGIYGGSVKLAVPLN